jgi:hypothetical protein
MNCRKTVKVKAICFHSFMLYFEPEAIVVKINVRYKCDHNLRMNHYTEDSVISDMVLHSPDSTSSEDEDNHAATSPGELSDDSSTVVPILCSNLFRFEQRVSILVM